MPQDRTWPNVPSWKRPMVWMIFLGCPSLSRIIQNATLSNSIKSLYQIRKDIVEFLMYWVFSTWYCTLWYNCILCLDLLICQHLMIQYTWYTCVDYKFIWQFRVHHEVIISVVLQLQAVAVVRADSEDSLVRKRREWILPARTLRENTDYTQKEYIAKVSHWSFLTFKYKQLSSNDR